MKKGFSLVELLLAAVILAFTLTGMLAVFTSCLFLNDANRNLAIATGHAQFAMEELKQAAFQSIAGANWNSAAITAKGLSPLDNEQISINVSGSSLLDAVVNVSWKDRGIRNRNVVLETLIAEL